MPLSINLLFENDVFKTLQNYFTIAKAQNAVWHYPFKIMVLIDMLIRGKPKYRKSCFERDD